MCGQPQMQMFFLEGGLLYAFKSYAAKNLLNAFMHLNNDITSFPYNFPS